MPVVLEDIQREILAKYHADRWYAHQTLFRHRHMQASAPMHREIVKFINAPRPRAVLEGFRGLGKSTLMEETIIIKALLREFHNLVIIGSSYRMACDRLFPIAQEIKTNPKIAALVDNLMGDVDREDRIVLSTGICIQALGRDAEMTGTKFGDWRPDAAVLDDVESPEEVRTDAERAQT